MYNQTVIEQVHLFRRSQAIVQLACCGDIQTKLVKNPPVLNKCTPHLQKCLSFLVDHMTSVTFSLLEITRFERVDDP